MDPVTTHHTTSLTAKQVHDDIEQTLRSLAAEPENFVEELEAWVKAQGATAWRLMKRHPFLATLVLGLGGTVAAATFGAAELWFGGALAFAAYKVLREGEPPMRVIEELEGVVKREV
jgi:hypothetical protein